MSDAETIHILKALADSTRLDIVRSLARSDCERSCAEVSECSDLSQPAKSHHLNKLVEANVLRAQKRGKQKFYTLDVARLKKAGINVKNL